jgi:hypothetical protein
LAVGGAQATTRAVYQEKKCLAVGKVKSDRNSKIFKKKDKKKGLTPISLCREFTEPQAGLGQFVLAR